MQGLCVLLEEAHPTRLVSSVFFFPKFKGYMASQKLGELVAGSV